ncbi:MAG: TetR/AcrR family transcriptional regulator [Bacilli bacterium]|nr:TetR/AcrR family transcriptional regulator [Bacilli bacterium]MBO4682830.1 TetR/AcrR family transcriptional regulator [Bacilli bacterium]
MRYRKDELTALERIYDATAALISEMDYNKINCSTIIKKANISRSTFYFYFKNKDQVVMHVCDDIFDHIFNHHLTKEKHHDFSKDKPDNLKHMVTHSFYHFLEDRDLILAILNSNASAIFLSRLRKRLKPLITSMMEKKIIGNSDIPADIMIHQLINGYTALLQYYLRHGYEFSPEKISEYYFKIYK